MSTVLTRSVEVHSNDAELQAIEGIAFFLKDLPKERALGILKYCTERVETDDLYLGSRASMKGPING